MRILKLDELPWQSFEAKKKKVFLRVDFNVPIKDGKILDDFRIRQTLPTIRYLQQKGCVVLIAAHMGRPQKVDAKKREELSLLPVAEYLAEQLDAEINFSEDIIGSGVRKLLIDARAGSVVVLENLRFDPREEKNDEKFGESLVENCDIYVDDAFGACHRAHASIWMAAKKSKCRAMGLLLQKEYEVLSSVLNSPKSPQMAILGGAKLEDKIKILERLLKSCQKVFVGGRMGLAFLAAKGVSIGGTEVSKESTQVAKRLMKEASRLGVDLFFPVDGRCATNIDATSCEIKDLKLGSELSDERLIFDIGPKTIEAWKKELVGAKSILWNGPMGVFENPVFAESTLALVDFLKEHRSEIQAIVGGGETVAAVAQRSALEDLYHVSTGGGAMLEFLEGKELPGLEILKLREREISDLEPPEEEAVELA